ncbi:PREDICTED: protein takeout-like [Rhagoletis zephyria]|uniref:protein takeout-like n=1 Tax=Rhagoletis zephyria TaxID=28612 RepID=UPI000811487C|nr:PREDICTED: protein takeout-like [Rhagoletis zephyria]
MYSSKLNFVLQSIFVIFLISCATAKLSSDLKRCVAGDSKCIIKNINTVFGEKNQGDESFGLSQTEPFKMEDIIIKQDPANPVAIYLALKNPVVYGTKNIRARKVKGFGKTPDGRHELLLHAPYISMISDYEIDGKVLILPIKGQGKSNITLVEPLMKMIIDATSRIEDGKTYLNIKDLRVECKPKRLAMHFENLFNGDKALGENLNSFLNENWKEIYNEMKRPWYDAIGKQMKEGATKIFNTTPYDEIFEIL